MAARQPHVTQILTTWCVCVCAIWELCAWLNLCSTDGAHPPHVVYTEQHAACQTGLPGSMTGLAAGVHLDSMAWPWDVLQKGLSWMLG